MDYKKILKNRKIRTKILEIFNFIPDKHMLKFQYLLKFNRTLNLSNPQRFTEKLQWYKLNYRNSIMQICVDKYSVREYVASKGLEHTLTDLYGVYDKFSDIRIENLPNQFVIKTTNGGGGINLVICRNKNNFSIDDSKKLINEWMVPKKIGGGREWAYYGLKPKIIIEKYLVNEKNPEAGISDYKFFCFNGKPKFLVVDIDRYIDHKRNFYDTKWNYIDVESDCPNFGDTINKPEGLEEMLKVATSLSEDFPFVRVDLYYVNNKVLFGEMTFYPWSGYVAFQPDEFDFTLGKEFNNLVDVRR